MGRIHIGSARDRCPSLSKPTSPRSLLSLIASGPELYMVCIQMSNRILSELTCLPYAAMPKVTSLCGSLSKVPRQVLRGSVRPHDSSIKTRAVRFCFLYNVTLAHQVQVATQGILHFMALHFGSTAALMPATAQLPGRPEKVPKREAFVLILINSLAGHPVEARKHAVKLSSVAPLSKDLYSSASDCRRCRMPVITAPSQPSLYRHKQFDTHTPAQPSPSLNADSLKQLPKHPTLSNTVTRKVNQN